MSMQRPFKTYNGGKGASGTIQKQINKIPPHGIKYVFFAGNCKLTSSIKPAGINLIHDIDSEVIAAWRDCGYPDNFRFLNVDSFRILAHMAEDSQAIVPKNSVFLYFDPPYRKETRRSKRDLYKYALTDDDHEILLGYCQLLSKKGYLMMLCCLANDELYEWALQGWNYFDYDNKIRTGMQRERCYYNYPEPTVLHDYRYYGDNFREREANNRIKKNLLKKLSGMDEVLRNSIVRDITETLIHF